MLQKVKKFGSKLFGDTDNKRDESMGGADELRSAGSMSRIQNGAKLRKVDMMEVDSAMHSPGSPGRVPGTIGAVHGNNMVIEHSSPSKSHLVLPPVQVSSNSMTSNASGTQASPVAAGSPPANIAAMLSPSAGSGTSGRRKSTPAALDMALRTAEGKQAIEDLINSAGKKQMVFGQYFGGPSKSPGSPDSKSNSSRFGKAAAMAGMPVPGTAKPVQTVIREDEEYGQHSGPSQAQQEQMIAAAAAAARQQAQYQAAAASRVPQAPAGYMAQHHMATQGSYSAGQVPVPHNILMQGPQPMDASLPPGMMQQQSSRPVATPQRRSAEAPAPQTQAPGYNKYPAQPQPVVVAPPPPPPMMHPQALPQVPTRILAQASQLPANMARRHWSMADYSILRKMYKGYASSVYQAICKKSLEQVALKVYHMANLCELNHYQVFREIRVHSNLSHQHIIALYCAFQEGNDVVMVQEYAEAGDLYRLLHRNGGKLSERQAVEMVLHPFLLSLHYLHTKGIMHRDIKPENVLFTDQRVLKLADFGLAIDMNEERAVTRAGTLDYMAPEVLRCPPKNLPQENKEDTSLHYSNSVDAWAVGVFAYELIVGLPPFAGDSQLASVDKIIHATPSFPEKISELAKSFITAALKKLPQDRPSVMEMLHHPWIRSYQRRTSVIIPQQIRRRSSVQYPGAGAPGGLAPTQEMMDIPGNPEDMTEEQIENVLQRLKMAKHAEFNGL